MLLEAGLSLDVHHLPPELFVGASALLQGAVQLVNLVLLLVTMLGVLHIQGNKLGALLVHNMTQPFHLSAGLLQPLLQSSYDLRPLFSFSRPSPLFTLQSA